MDQITIQGLTFNVPDRYTEGHVLTANEASALNQTYHENLRNNFAKKVKDAGESPDVEALQASLDEYAAAYQFGVRVAGAPRAPADPVGKEAFAVAREAVRGKLREKGINPSAVDAKQLGELVAGALEKYKDRFYTIAAKRIADREALAAEALDLDTDNVTVEDTSESEAA